MRQITRDLYTSGKVWLSLSHSFTQKSGDKYIDLIKVNPNGDFITLNAGALFVLSLWGYKEYKPQQFYIPEWKIDKFKRILESLMTIKEESKLNEDEGRDETYITGASETQPGTLTVAGKSSSLYYRIKLYNKKFIDIYLVENNYNGDKSINVAIEYNNKEYRMYDSNVLDMIDVIPSMAEITRYKQSAAELYYLQNYLMNGINVSSNTVVEEEQDDVKRTPRPIKKAKPKEIKKVDRTELSKKEKIYVEDPEPEPESRVEEEPEIETPTVEETPVVEETVEENEVVKENSIGFDYSDLLEDD